MKKYSLVILFLFWFAGFIGIASNLFAFHSEDLLFSKNDMSAAPTLFRMPYLETPASVVTLTAEELREHGVRKISEALSYINGTFITNSDRHIDRLYLRGVGGKYNNKILLLIDGIPFKEPVYQHAFLNEYIPIEDVKMIEVTYGPASAIYGTNSLAGVINIITYKPEENDYTNIAASIGSDQSHGLYFRAVRNKRNTSVLFSGKYYNAVGEGPGTTSSGRDLIYNEDPVSLHYLHTEITHKNFIASLCYHGLEDKYTVGYDLPNDKTYFRYNDLLFNAKYIYDFSDNLFIRTYFYNNYFDDANIWYSYAYSDTDRLNYTRADVVKPIKKSNSMGHSAALYCILPKGSLKNQLVVGYDYEYKNIINVRDTHYKSDGSSYIPYYIKPVKEHTVGLFTEYGIIMKNINFLTNLRLDHYTEFGYTFNPRLSFLYKPARTFSIKGAWGMAYRAPSAREFYTISTQDFHQGNPELKPERISMPELIFSYQNKTARANLNLFYNKYSDFITVGPEDTSPYINEICGSSYGAEFGSALFLPPILDLHLNLSYIDASDMSNIPHFKAVLLQGTRITKEIHLNFEYSYYSSIIRNKNDSLNRGDIKPAFLTNANLVFAGDNSSFTLSVKNLFDRRYYFPRYVASKADIRQPCRTFYLEFHLYL